MRERGAVRGRQEHAVRVVEEVDPAQPLRRDVRQRLVVEDDREIEFAVGEQAAAEASDDPPGCE